MLKFRRLLGSTFGFLALVFLLASVSVVPVALRAFRDGSLLPPGTHAAMHPVMLTGTLRIFLGVFLLIPPVFALCFGMAAWTIRRGVPSARPWALAASAVVLLQTVPLLLAMGFVAIMEFFFRPGSFRPHSIHWPVALVFITIAYASIGVAGLVAFVPRDSVRRGLASKIKPPRVAGDGTSTWADALAWILGTVGYLAGMEWWYRWAHSQGLPFSYGILPWMQLLAALLVSVAFHEAGHAIAGLCLGMKLRLFLVGPFQWRIRDGRWTFQFNLKKTFSVGGATGCVPVTPDWERGDEICMIAAGPIASFAVGCFAAALAISAQGEWYQSYWEFFAVLATISLMGAVVNLLPLRPEALYSDGAQIYQLLKGGPWADFHRVQALVASTLVTPLRPRDYDIQAIETAGKSFSHDIHALLLHLYASSYFLDRGQLDQARDSFRQAESLYAGIEQFVNADLLTAFVFRSALLCRDAAASHTWLERLEAAKPPHRGVDYWLARSAERWIEGSLGEARTAWHNASSLVVDLPHTGAYEFDRYRSELLREEIARTEHESEHAEAESVYAAPVFIES